MSIVGSEDLHTRIRELETANDEYLVRISKAREILEASSGMEGYVEEDIQRALNALEGK